MAGKNAANQAEAEFLKSYNPGKYPHPSVTSDIVALSVQEAPTGNFRRPTVDSMSVLLIRRGGHPFKGCWALPGGFLNPSETIEECAARELREETGLRGQVLMPLKMFSKPGRDPRDWVISQAFLAIVRKSESRVAGGDDAAEARWFSISNTADNGSMTIVLKSGDETITYSVRHRADRYGQHTIRGAVARVGGGSLAFDHGEIIASALLRLRSADADSLAFAFLPPEFTIAELQHVHEFICGRPLLGPNFRRRISQLIAPVEGVSRGSAGHRPAAVYMRK